MRLFLGGVIRIVRVRLEGEWWSSKKRNGSYWRNWGGSTVSVRTPQFFLVGLLQNRNEIKCAIQIAKIIHSDLPRTVKKGKLDPRALLGILI